MLGTRRFSLRVWVTSGLVSTWPHNLSHRHSHYLTYHFQGGCGQRFKGLPNAHLTKAGVHYGTLYKILSELIIVQHNQMGLSSKSLTFSPTFYRLCCFHAERSEQPQELTWMGCSTGADTVIDKLYNWISFIFFPTSSALT